MKKVLLVCNTSGSILSFRKNFIKKLIDSGYTVATVAFDDQYKAEVMELGVDFYCINDKNRSINPLKILNLKKKYVRIIKEYKPDVAFTFMLKPNIFGTRAAKKAGVRKIFSMVEGTGDVFINNSFKWKLIRFVVCKMYRKSFKLSQKVIFLNNDDKKEFLDRKLVKSEQCEMIHGIGVDLQHFEQKPLTNNKTFLMIARMLKTKGIMEYCQAARAVKNKYPDAIFNYIGGEGTVTVADIQEYIDDGSINYLGTTDDVRPQLEESSVYVLPSYREGMSVSIMEAQSVGRAVITTDTNGCRDMILDGENGFLVEVGNPEQLAEKMEWFLNNPENISEMGKSARRFAQEHFDQVKINEKLLMLMETN